MYRVLVLFALVVIALFLVACRDGKTGLARLTDQLPQLVPSADEMGGLVLGGSSKAETRSTVSEFMSNTEMSENWPGARYFSGDLEEIRASGRVDGYVVAYRTSQNDKSGREMALVGAGVAIEVYADSAAAQRALERKPLFTSGDAIAIPLVGDASKAWPHAIIGGGPACPCHFKFRVGPLVAFVSVSGPTPMLRGQELDPRELAVAEMMEPRMREAARRFLEDEDGTRD